MKIINKIKRYINRLRRRFRKKEVSTKPFFENPAELKYTPFIKADDRCGVYLSKLTWNAKTLVGRRFESCY